MKHSNNLFKRSGLILIAVCVACCSFPVMGVLLGIGTLSVMAPYIKWAGIVLLVLSVASFTFYYFKRKSVPACDINCESKAELNAKQF